MDNYFQNKAQNKNYSHLSTQHQPEFYLEQTPGIHSANKRQTPIHNTEQMRILLFTFAVYGSQTHTHT